MVVDVDVDVDVVVDLDLVFDLDLVLDLVLDLDRRYAGNLSMTSSNVSKAWCAIPLASQ